MMAIMDSNAVHQASACVLIRCWRWS